MKRFEVACNIGKANSSQNPPKDIRDLWGYVTAGQTLDDLSTRKDLSVLLQPQGHEDSGEPYVNYRFHRIWAYTRPDPWDYFSLGSTSDTGSLIFDLEYLCTQGAKSNPERFSLAAKSTRTLLTRLYSQIIPALGKYADNQMMVLGGYAEDSEERTADWLASQVFASYINRYPSLEDRRLKMVSRVVSFCPVKNTEKKTSDLQEIEKRLSTEAHSVDSERIREFMTAPVREAIQCKLDFPNATNCSL